VADPIARVNGVDPDQPQNVLGVPDPPVLVRILQLWGQQRKAARVLLVLDVSGSMGDPADNAGHTKLDLAKQASIDALSQFKDEDAVGLRIFSTELSRTPPTDYVDLAPIAPIGPQREQLATKIRALTPTNGTPLYTVTNDSYTVVREGYDESRINAVVVLTDGRNEDSRNNDVDRLLANLEAVHPGVEHMLVSARTGEGVDGFRDYLTRVAARAGAAA
jgi:Ca-activated chloride channel family protein